MRLMSLKVCEFSCRIDINCRYETLQLSSTDAAKIHAWSSADQRIYAVS